MSAVNVWDEWVKLADHRFIEINESCIWIYEDLFRHHRLTSCNCCNRFTKHIEPRMVASTTAHGHINFLQILFPVRGDVFDKFFFIQCHECLVCATRGSGQGRYNSSI